MKSQVSYYSFLYSACISRSFQNNFTPNPLRIAIKNFKPVLLWNTLVLHMAAFYILLNRPV